MKMLSEKTLNILQKAVDGKIQEVSRSEMMLALIEIAKAMTEKEKNEGL